MAGVKSLWPELRIFIETVSIQLSLPDNSAWHSCNVFSKTSGGGNFSFSPDREFSILFPFFFFCAVFRKYLGFFRSYHGFFGRNERIFRNNRFPLHIFHGLQIPFCIPLEVRIWNLSYKSLENNPSDRQHLITSRIYALQIRSVPKV